MQAYLEVGQIVNTFGVKGQVKVNHFCDDMRRFDQLKMVYLVYKDKLEPIEIEKVQYHKDMVLLKLKGIDTIEQAQTLKGIFLKIDRKDAIPLPKGTYFIADLIGLCVYSDEEEYLGKVEDIYNTGANDIYVVKNDLGVQLLLPGIPEVIRQVDLENGQIRVHLLEGLR